MVLSALNAPPRLLDYSCSRLLIPVAHEAEGGTQITRIEMVRQFLALGILALPFVSSTAEAVDVPCYKIGIRISAYPGVTLRNVRALVTHNNAATNQLLIDEAGNTVGNAVDVCAIDANPSIKTNMEIYSGSESSIVLDATFSSVINSNTDISINLRPPPK
jgi:hypothetical protein